MDRKTLLALAYVPLACGCAPIPEAQGDKPDGAVPSQDQFFDAMTAPLKRSDDKNLTIFLNCSEFWKVQCKLRQQSKADCAYQVSRVSWDHAQLARDPAGTWRWISGDRLCPWTGKASI